MRHKEYIETCEICSKTYIATRKGSSVCGNVCRAQKSRNKKASVYNHLLSQVPLSGEFERLVIELAKLRGKNEDWISEKIKFHKVLLISDAHHGYNEDQAILKRI